ncbi:MAG: hypothetical protein EXS39_06200 [Opitutaceae bacterium]|nr:hypothetical protein [Opitutaceae bacterium]
MSDTASSGAPAAAPSEPLPAPDSPTASAPAATPAPVGTFGTARGSGLARGKRPTQPAATTAASSSNATYKPTSIEVITPQREYKNPFASEQPSADPAPEAATVPAFSLAPQVKPEPVAPAPMFVPPVAPVPASELFPFNAPVAPVEKPELDILPPAEPKRVAQNWEASPLRGPAATFEPRRDERPTFRPERTEHREQPRDPRDQKFAPREPRGDFARRDSRREQPRDPRDSQPTGAPVAPPQKSGGFLGWLKSLFSGPAAKPETTRDHEDRGSQDRDGEHRHHRRRHRGGRGRGFHGGQPRDPRDGPAQARFEGGPSHPAGEGHGDQQGDGFSHRRRRGGRGRHRNDHGSDPHPEGTQGGGAI